MIERNRIILIVLLISVALVASLFFAFQLRPSPQPETVRFAMTTFTFGFNVTDVPNFIDGKVYPSPTLTVHNGDRVIIELRSLDVTHGFAIDEFNVNAYIVPGETVTVNFIADKVGNFTYYCNVFCGVGHPYMHGILQVLP